MKADLKKLAELSGTDVSWLQEGMHALNAIAAVHKQIFEERTGVNRAATEKKATVKQLADTLPPEEQAADAGDLPGLRAQSNEMIAKRDQELTRISTKLAGLRTEHEMAMEALRDEQAAEVEEMRKRHQAALEAKREAFTKSESAANAQTTKTNNAFHVDHAKIQQRITAAESIQNQMAKADQTRQTIATLQADVDALNADSEAKTAALAALEKYKGELLESLPIPGLEVRGGEIFRHDVQFDRLNTAQQVEVAVEIAKLRAGKLGLICVDGIEVLDSGAYEEFKAQALNSGLQMVVARVSDDDFQVTT
jgi:chromosome segregation ATPase